MASIEDIKKKIAEIESKKESLVKDLRKDFFPLLQPLFEKSEGKVKSIRWTQYTPYFNDGDTCEFSTNFAYDLVVNGLDPDSYDEDLLSEEELKFVKSMNPGVYGKITAENYDAHQAFNKGPMGYEIYAKRAVGEDGFHPNPDFDIQLYLLIKEFRETLMAIPDDFYESLFGDHQEVTVNSNGKIDTETYEHD